MLSLIYKAIEAYNVPEFQVSNAKLAECIASLELALK